MRSAAETASGANGAGAVGTGNGAAGPGGAGAVAPRFRGVLHAAAFPAAAVAGAVLIALGPTQQARLAAAVYSMTCMALFGVSAAYHRSPPASRRRGLLARLIWRSAWRPAPRWLITSLFIALGWVAVFVLPQLLRGAGPLVLALVLAGGLLYSLGAVVYTLKRPNPSPRWFGFHEVFHAMTILAYLTQYAAVSLVVYRAT